MDTEKIAIRALLRHYWKKGFSARAATEEICAVEGEGVIGKSAAANWFQRFQNGDTSLEDKSRSGRPPSVDTGAVREAVEESPASSSRELASELGVSQSSIVRHLHKLGKVYRSCRVVPHELTPAQVQRRVEICEQLLSHPRDERFIRQIVTCDEKWIFYRNPDMRKQWLDPRQLAKPVPKHDRFERKVMLCIWWNYEGPIYYEFVPDGRAINAELYSQQLDRMYLALAQRYPALVNRRRALLQQDNAPAHTARRTRQKLQELEGIELLPHPAFSPDLAPSDYYLFRSMAHFLQGRQFENFEQVEAGINEFLASKDKQWYHRGITQLAERWIKTIQHNGLYFED